MGEYEQLQGRIVALELAMRALIVDFAMRIDSDPEVVEKMRQEMMSSLQFATRPVGESEDETWSHAVDALNELFDEAKKRIENL